MARRNNIVHKTLVADEAMASVKHKLKTESKKAEATYKVFNKMIRNGTGKLVYRAIIERHL